MIKSLIAVLLLFELSGTVGQCTNTCIYASDSLCDDGGPGATWSDCALGTDCMDCGPRSSHSHTPHSHSPTPLHSHTPHVHTPHSHSPTPSHSHTPHSHSPTPSHSHTPHSHTPHSHSPTPVGQCTNTCIYATDGYCHEPFSCQYGTDCTDCGPSPPAPPAFSLEWYCRNRICENTEFIWMPEPDPTGKACITDMDCMCNENPKFEPEVCAECEAAGISWFQTNPPFWKNRCIPVGFKVLLCFSMASFILSLLIYLRQLYRHCTGQHRPTNEYPGDWYTCCCPTDAIFQMQGCKHPLHNILAAIFGFFWLASCYVGVCWKPSLNLDRNSASVKV